MRNIVQGSIVWAEAADARGHAKRRPLLILTPTSEILLDAPIQAACITTTFTDPPAPALVELPWHPRRHPITGLTRPSAVVCSWLVELRPSQVIDVAGIAPTRTLLEILRTVRACNSPPQT